MSRSIDENGTKWEDAQKKIKEYLEDETHIYDWPRVGEDDFSPYPLNCDDKPELLFLIGLPASGKTVWAKLKVSMDKSYVRVSRDDLRNMRGIYWIPEQEGMIADWELSIIVNAIESGKSVILDATNLNEARRAKFVQRVRLLANIRFTVNKKVFNTSVEECIKRDDARTEGKIGKKVILQMAKDYGLETKCPVHEHQIGRYNAIICDLDGTLAHNYTGRGFYDWDRVGEDTVDPIIRGILDRYEDVQIIIMSGRDEACLAETEKWLYNNSVEFDVLLMRKAGDSREDLIIKKELFDLHIKNKYNVLFALDDRDQVVDMWRKELGIKCLQVNYGDF